MKEWTEGPTREAVRRRRLRIIIPAYPAFNIYSRVARATTALGPVTVATAAREMEGWDVEVIDENNYQRSGPVTAAGLPAAEIESLIRIRHRIPLVRAAYAIKQRQIMLDGGKTSVTVAV